MFRMSETDKNRSFALEVVRRLRDAGHESLWAGGCVRDQLLGKTPKDYDVATSAQPHSIREIFGHSRTLAVGAAFGVITVLGGRGARPIEVATFRKDSQYSDGRHPDAVVFSTAEEDAQRRDFTINGIFFDPLKEQVIDYVGGQADLQLKIVRAIRNPFERFDEDKLRMLRAIRFAANLEFTLEPSTLAAIQQLAGELVIVSAERIAGEMERLLCDPNRRRGLELLRNARLLPIVLPESVLLEADSEEDGSDHGRGEAWRQSLAILDSLRAPTFPMTLAALLRRCVTAGSEENSVRKICSRWRLSHEVMKETTWLLANEAAVRGAADLPWPRLQRILVAPFVRELLDYGQAVADLLDGTRQQIEYCRERLAWPVERLNPLPLLGGDDLIAAGWKPGPAFREVIDRVRDAQLDGKITTREQALALAQQLVPHSRPTEKN